MVNTKTVTNISGLEVYLEGLKIHFSSIQISEAEGTIPSLAITFSSDYRILRIPASTNIQVFGDVYNDQNQKESCLLFEGELTGSDLVKDPAGGYQVVLKFTHLFNRMLTARLRPTDSIVTKQKEMAEYLQKTNVTIMNDKSLDKITTQSMINLDLLNTENAKDIEIKGALSKLGSMTRVGGLGDEFARLLQTDGVKKGNYQLIFDTFNKYFEFNDIFYGILSNSYKLSQSIFSFPNPGYSNPLMLKAIWESFTDYVQNTQNFVLGEKKIYTLYEVLARFQEFVNYQFIVPTAPTAVKSFFNNLDNNYHYPLRGFYFPRLENGVPILPNVIFPSQVSRITFSRDLVNEVTRQISQTSWSLLDGRSLPEWINPIYVLPSLEISTDKNGAVISNYTQEESFRGVNLAISTYDGVITKAFYDNKTNIDVKLGKEVIGKDVNLKNEIGVAMRVFSVEQYLHNRYSSRIARVVTSWNPYRLIGFPAVFFDLNGPTILGIIASINTTIDSNGAATSEISLRNCRLIYDEDLQTEFNPIINKTADMKGLEKYLLNDLTTDKLTSINEFLFSPDLYSFDTIGQDVYTYLVKGISHKNRKFEKFAKDSDMFKSYSSNLTENSFPSDPYYDYSILKFLKNDNNIILPSEYKEEDLKKLPKEIVYTLKFYLAIKELKNSYKQVLKNSESLKTADIIDKFMRSVNYRRLTTKDEYKRFTNVSYDQSNHYRDTKDLYKLLKSLDRQIVLNTIAKGTSTITTDFYVEDSSKFNESTLSETASLFKPFNIIRRAHVLYAFKKYLSFSSTKKSYMVD